MFTGLLAKRSRPMHEDLTTVTTGTRPAQGQPPPARWEKEVSASENLEREQPPVPGGVCLLGVSNIRL